MKSLVETGDTEGKVH